MSKSTETFSIRDRRGGEWFIVHNAIVQHYGPQIGAYGIAVYCALCSHANRVEQAELSVPTIAREIAASPNRVRQSLAHLEAAGLIHVKHRKAPDNDKLNLPSVYTLLAVSVPDKTEGTSRGEVPQDVEYLTTEGTSPREGKQDKESNIDSSLDADPPQDDIRLRLETFGVQGQTLDNLTLKAIMDGVSAADIAALVDAARADFAARRAEFNAAAFLANYPYRFGWTYQPRPRKTPPTPVPFTPPPDYVTHQEVVTPRPRAILPDVTPCPLTAAERKQKWHEAIARRRNAFITT